MPEVTVVIPNYNGMTYLDTCLASLKRQTIEDFVILVVDNGSTDGSLSWLAEHYPEVRVLPLDKNYGFCVAVNRGIQAADTPYVILLNNDTEAEPEFVEALLAAVRQSDRIFSCQAKMMDFAKRGLMDDAGDFYCAFGWGFARGKGQPQQRYDRDVDIFAACAGAAIYKRVVFDEIGWFDEKHFAYLEDIDLGYRARLYGYVNRFASSARVYHMGSATTGSRHNGFKVRLSARNSLYVAYKNMPLPQLILNSPLLALGILGKLLFFSRKRLGKEYRQGIAEGFSLCKRENKVCFDRTRRRNSWRLQPELWKNVIVAIRRKM